MKRVRALAAAVALVLLVLSAGPALARWKGISDVFMDDGGRVCRNGIEFSLAHFFPANESAEITNVSADPDVVVVPSTPLAQLRFGPVPELFNSGDYYYSSTYRVRFPNRLPIGTQLQVDLRGTSNASDVPPPVAKCALGRAVSKFIGLSDPPDVNDVTTTPIALKLRIPGPVGLDIFSEDPLFAPIPCAPLGTNPGYVPTAATGTLSVAASTKTYTYLWAPPTGLTGCQEVWFRLKRDGLQHRVLFDFGP